LCFRKKEKGGVNGDPQHRRFRIRGGTIVNGEEKQVAVGYLREKKREAGAARLVLKKSTEVGDCKVKNVPSGKFLSDEPNWSLGGLLPRRCLPQNSIESPTAKRGKKKLKGGPSTRWGGKDASFIELCREERLATKVTTRGGWKKNSVVGMY